jgi:membrane dipeptidase
VHCHPGLFFFEGMAMPEDPMIQKMASVGVFTERTVADMAAGQLSAALFATVADAKIIGFREYGLYAHREFEPGEAYADHLRQMSVLQKMVDTGLVAPVRSVSDLLAAKQAGKVGAVFSCEGGDFLEEEGERLTEAWEAGIRSIQLVHYHINQLGDIQTDAPKHNGLTEFGRETVAEMNRLGMIIDMAHATFETTRDAAELSTQPIMVSHSFIADEDIQNPRLLSEDHARLVAETGGLVGAWPAGIGNPDFPSFIDRLMRLVDLIGIDHVGLGTDMDANFRPVFTNYRQLPQIPVVLKRRGMSDGEIVKVLGGNFIRVFDEVTRGSGGTA